MRRWSALVALMLVTCGVPTHSSEAQNSGCAAYCNLMLLNCTDGNLVFINREACLQTCATYSATGGVGDTQGNTLQCRVTYATAAPSSPIPFCRDASPSGGDACK